MGDLKTDMVAFLVLLEKKIPPWFFDIMMHLLVHLVEDLELCCPRHTMDVPYWVVPQNLEGFCAK